MFPTIPTGGGSSTKIPLGLQQSVIYGISYVGKMRTNYANQGERWTEKVLVHFEFPNHLIEVDRNGQKVMLPLVSTLDMTYSLGQKSKLYSLLTSLNINPSNFNIANLIGLNLNCNIVQSPNSKSPQDPYHNIGSFSPLMTGVQQPVQPMNQVIKFSIVDENPDNMKANFKLLNNYWKGKIAESCELWPTVRAMLEPLMDSGRPAMPQFNANPNVAQSTNGVYGNINQQFAQQPIQHQQQPPQQYQQQYQQQVQQNSPASGFMPNPNPSYSTGSYGSQTDDIPF